MLAGFVTRLESCQRLVLCVDEKSGIQALERTQSMLPPGLGYVEGVTHDYRRHGTMTLFAAPDTAKGRVLTRCQQHHRHKEYLRFLREIERTCRRHWMCTSSWITTLHTNIRE